MSEEGSKSRKAQAYGYRTIKEIYREGMKLADLMKALQRQVSETERESQEQAIDKKDYAQRFILDIFAEAFNSFMQERYAEEYHEIMSPERNDEEAKNWVNVINKKDNNSEKVAVHLKTSFDENDIEGYLLVLYPVMRLLDNRELSELQQQMLRFRASMSKWQGETDFSEDTMAVERIEELAELVKLTEPVSQNTGEMWERRTKEAFKDFMEGDMSDYGSFYLQSNDSTPVLRRNMSRLLRSGIIGVYKEVFRNHMQATKGDYDIYLGKHWNVKRPDGIQIATAGQAQALLQRLHNKYAASPSQFSEDDYKLYDEVLKQLEKYNQAMENLTFSSLYEVCCIHMEILSRWIGFAEDWERDMYFLLLAWAKQGKLYGKREDDVAGIFEKGRVVGKIQRKLKKGNRDAFRSIYCKEANVNLDFLEVRNEITHLELLRSNKWVDAENLKCSVMECYLNCLRILLSYNQKRMDAVTKTMQQIFKKHNCRIIFTVENGGKLKIKDVIPESIVHLKEKFGGIEIPSHGVRFINSLEALMVYPRA